MSETTGTLRSSTSAFEPSSGRIGLPWQSVGWSVVGAPPDLPRFLVVIAPHRSARSVPGLLLIAHSRLKHSLARQTHAVLVAARCDPARPRRRISVDRRSASVVEKLGGTFGRARSSILALMPEGSRSRAGAPVRDWKRSGYFHIANAASVPVLPIAVDSERKRFVFGQPLPTSAGRDALAADLQTFFDQALMSNASK